VAETEALDKVIACSGWRVACAFAQDVPEMRRTAGNTLLIELSSSHLTLHATA
jgi:hypothetical protein